MGNTHLIVSRIYDYIDSFAPFCTCESWDNSGLLAGSMQKEVHGILFALDFSHRVLNEALSQNTDLIVTHHPILFSGKKNLREDDEEGLAICELIRSHISLISAHTNFDKAAGGVNDMLTERLGLYDVGVIENDAEGYVRLGLIDPVPLKDFACHVRKTLGDAVRVYGGPEKMIRTVAVCGGAGGEFAFDAMKAGADAYVTGEMRYHDSMDLAQKGFATLHCGHDATEKLAMEKMKAVVSDGLKRDGFDIPLKVSCTDIFSMNFR
jgi:dinuclear metal center YbgI/SA1388 family protein